jgi:hypothetical protein
MQSHIVQFVVQRVVYSFDCPDSHIASIPATPAMTKMAAKPAPCIRSAPPAGRDEVEGVLFGLSEAELDGARVGAADVEETPLDTLATEEADDDNADAEDDADPEEAEADPEMIPLGIALASAYRAALWKGTQLLVRGVRGV